MAIQNIPEDRLGSITDYLAWDHDRLDSILVEVAKMVDGGDLARAETGYRDFELGLRRHIRIEEEMLFPLFERKTGITQGPTMVMRHEHQLIDGALTTMREGLGRSSADQFRRGHQELLSVLGPHNDKEEHVLYPMTDRALSDAERIEFTRKIAAE